MGILGRVFGGSGGGPRAFYEHCGWCGAGILHGDRHVAVTRSVEKADEGGVSVLDAEAALVLCERCGGRLGADEVRRALENGPPAPGPPGR